MACGCHKSNAHASVTADASRKAAVAGGAEQGPTTQGSYSRQGEERAKPLDQCLFCAQKHADEALVAMNEFTYDLENRSFIHGSLRSVVNHTFKSWPDIAYKARDAALKWQEARFDEARKALDDVIRMIDDTIMVENPDIKERKESAEKAGQEQKYGKTGE